MEDNYLITDEISEQILEIRDSGECNMLDLPGVQQEAFHWGFYGLVIFIEEHKQEYANFILTGDRGKA